MAVQAGCGFKQPTPVFAVPLPVTGEPPRPVSVTSPQPRDPGSDVIVAGRRSGQWVTLSKTLLLQLVERICQLSFQTDVTSSNASSRLCRKPADEFGPEVDIESFWRRSSLVDSGGGSSDRVFEKDRQDEMEDCAAAEENQGESVPTLRDYDQTTSGSGETPADLRSPAVTYCEVDRNSAVELDAVDTSSNVENSPTECSATVEESSRGPSDASTSEEKLLRHRHHQRRRRHQRSVSRHRLLRTRRRKKAALATSSGQVRCLQLVAGRGNDTRAVVGWRPQLRGVQRRRQSWMALSKDIVYGAVENQLRQVDGSCRSVVPAVGGSSPSKSPAIWNPATCLSPSEKRRSRPFSTDLDCAPSLSDFRYREVTYRQHGSDVINRPCNATPVGGSSMLSELLGFVSATPTVVLPRQRRCSYDGGEGGETMVCDVISPPVVSGSGIKANSHTRPESESGPGHDDVTTALNYCIRRDTSNPDEEVANVVPRIWRPVESYPVQSTSRRVARPRWVAVDKGDVCSLVDDLVSTMIMSEDGSTATSVSGDSGDVRDASTLLVSPHPPPSSSSSSRDKPALPVTARCTVAASEPRKWKSDLLQRMRNEDT